MFSRRSTDKKSEILFIMKVYGKCGLYIKTFAQSHTLVQGSSLISTVVSLVHVILNSISD